MAQPSEATRQGWRVWRQRNPPFVTDAGFGPTAIVVDETTGCYLSQGCMLYRQPHARLHGQNVRPRVLAFRARQGTGASGPQAATNLPAVTVRQR